MIFFIYSSVLFNKGLKKAADYDLISGQFYVSLTALTAFSIFFINYAHSAFMKSRNKEFGVYLTLGMNSTDLRKIVNIENLIIILSSFTAGIISGVLFSRLFQMIVLELLNISYVHYSLDYRSFALTIAVFVAIFSSVIVLSSLETRKLDISELLKESRKKEGKQNKEVLLGLIGVFILLIALILLILMCKNEKVRSKVPILVLYFILSFAGTYMTVSYISKALMSLIKNSNYYFKNILSITEINHKFNQNKKIIFILSILSSMTLSFVAPCMAGFRLTEHLAKIDRTNNIEFFQLGNINNLSQNQFNSILKKAKTPVKNASSIEFISLELQGVGDKEDITKSVPIVSQDIYNSVTKRKIRLDKGEALNIITTWGIGYHGVKPSSNINLSDGSKSFNFTVKDSVRAKWIAFGETYDNKSGVVISNEDYNYIKNNITKKNIGIYHGVSFKNWKETETTVDSFTSELNKNNEKLEGDEKKLSPLLKVTSTVKSYNDIKQRYSFYVFVSTVMGILFFIAGGSVLFFKQYTELSNDKARFMKLYKVGITEKEVTNIIEKELRVTFFMPLVIGSLLGYCFIYLFTIIFGGKDIINSFMLNATFVIIIYFLFQYSFYYITKRKYVNEVISSL